MRDSGHTLVELLVSMALSSVALALVARDFGYHVHTRREMDLFADTQQALNSSVTFVTQELRQAGACMPELGDFIALDGENQGDRDVLLLRIGVANQTSLRCARDLLFKRGLRYDAQVELENASAFVAGQWIYIVKSSGQGNFFKVSSVDYTNNVLSLASELDRNYGKGSGVYALEERRYEVVEMSGSPVLTLSIDGSEPQPMANGVEKFNIRYKMDPCPPCTAVDDPGSDTNWRVVREVELTVGVRSAETGPDGQYVHLDSTTTVKPRNLL